LPACTQARTRSAPPAPAAPAPAPPNYCPSSLLPCQLHSGHTVSLPSTPSCTPSTHLGPAPRLRLSKGHPKELSPLILPAAGLHLDVPILTQRHLHGAAPGPWMRQQEATECSTGFVDAPGRRHTVQHRVCGCSSKRPHSAACAVSSMRQRVEEEATHSSTFQCPKRQHAQTRACNCITRGRTQCVKGQRSGCQNHGCCGPRPPEAMHEHATNSHLH
jgi:hypothetical protein